MGIVESGRCDTAFNSVSMSRVKDVEVGAGIDVVEVHGVVGADGQGVGASVGKEGGVCPVACGPWSRLGEPGVYPEQNPSCEYYEQDDHCCGNGGWKVEIDEAPTIVH